MEDSSGIRRLILNVYHDRTTLKETLINASREQTHTLLESLTGYILLTYYQLSYVFEIIIKLGFL